jgi:hypothetical protein
LALPVLAAANSAHASGGLWLKDEDIRLLRKEPARTAGLLRQCEKEITEKISPLADLAPPPHYSATGTVHSDVAASFSADARRSFRAGMCYVVSQDQRYASYAQKALTAWGDTLRAVSSEQGRAEINFNLPYFVLAASMVRGVNGWDDTSFRHLLTEVALPIKANNTKNNHANWQVFRDASIAAYIGDAALLERTRQHWMALMDSQVDTDGSLPLEICRSGTTNWCDGPDKGINGISYTHYTLAPTTAAARIFDLQGRPVWQTPEGGKLGAAFRKAAAWTRHPESFPYYASNNGKLNGVNNDAYFLLLQRYYPNEDAANVIKGGKLGMDTLGWALIFGDQ